MLLHRVSNKVAGMVADMADGMVADMTADNIFFIFRLKKFLADMDVDMLADKEVDKLIDMVGWLVTGVG